MNVTIDLYNRINGDVVKVQYTKVNGLWFHMITKGIQSSTHISGLKMPKSGILREHPDLMGLSYNKMRKEAVKRLNEKLMSFKKEEEIKDYIINELSPYGYVEWKGEKFLHLRKRS